MIPWILFILSSVALLVLFVRRLRMTYKDLHFQKQLDADEDLPIVQEELPLEAPISVELDFDKILDEALHHVKRREWQMAEPLLLLVLEADPLHLEAHHHLGMAHMHMENFPQAELFFSKLVNLQKDPATYSNLGAALYRQQRLIEAAEAYENAVAMDGKRPERLQSLAQVYYELGDNDKALHYFERAAHLKPRDVDLMRTLATYYERLGRLDDAKMQLKKAHHTAPNNEDIKLELDRLMGL